MTPLPCPACHAVPTVDTDPWGLSCHVVCCTDADSDGEGGFVTTGIVGNGKTPDEAVEDWNQQVEDEA